MHEVQFSTNHQWHVGQEIRQVVFQESFVIPPCNPVWMCGKHLQELRKSVYHSAVLESLNSETMHFRTYVDINCFYYLHMRNTFLKLCRVFLNTLYKVRYWQHCKIKQNWKWSGGMSHVSWGLYDICLARVMKSRNDFSQVCQCSDPDSIMAPQNYKEAFLPFEVTS
jgi:hypothetical protein